MKKFALLLFLALPLFASDEDEVRAVAQKYFQAHATGNAAPLREAFHPDWRMMSVRDGALATRTLEQYTSGFTGKAPADEAQRKRSIEQVDITGNAAMVKIRLDYPAATLTDYMLLLKVDGKWQVVSKIFHSAPKAK
ncbi:MAG TPA: nuclear transport factor 2 family protein [Thermoanaerobaculia bacterium]|nr:nuclear transport factor 2 family protein [Thermoanaerobaculia bacterium]